MRDSDRQVLELLKNGKPMFAEELAEGTGLSKATVYRVIKRLHSEDLIDRIAPGIAVIKQPETAFDVRLKANIEKKREIASKAVALVEDGDAIFVDASTTCLAFVQELAKSELSGLSIVTNSTYVVNELDERAGDFYIVCTGGELQPSLNALVGSIVRSRLEVMKFNKAFVSCAAFSLERGLMTTQTSLVDVTRAASESASSVIVLVDSTKFEKQALLNALGLSRVSVVVSDKGLPRQIRTVLQSKGIQVL